MKAQEKGTKQFSLEDGLKVSTSDMDEMRRLIEDISARTETVDINGSHINIYSLRADSCPKFGAHKVPGKAVTERLSLSDVNAINAYNNRSMGLLKIDEIGESLLKEARDNGMFLISIGDADKKKYSVSSYALQTLLQRAGIGGETALRCASPIRDMFLEEGLCYRQENMKMLFRKDDEGHVKAFSFFSPTYQHIPQTILLEIIDGLDDKAFGEKSLYDCTITQAYTDISIEYPEAAEAYAKKFGFKEKLIPGISLHTSDLGICSLSAQLTFRAENSKEPAVIKEFRMKHSKNNDAAKLVGQINDELDSLKRYPSKFCGLNEEILDYKTTDIATEDGGEKNLDAAFGVISQAFKALYANIENFPAEQQKNIEGMVKDELLSDTKYTYFDLAMKILSVPERVTALSRARMNYVRTETAKIPEAILKIKKAHAA